MTVLLVDDDPDDRLTFFEVLNMVAPTTKYLEAGDGREGLQLLDTLVEMPDYVFLDLNMPTMNGRICLRFIKENPRTKDIPVIMYSTTISPKDRLLFQSINVQFLEKPDTYDVLKKELKKILFENV